MDTLINVIVSLDHSSAYFLNAAAGVFPLLDEIFIMLAEGTVFVMVGAIIMYLFKTSRSQSRLLLLGEVFVSTLIARFIFVTALRSLHFRFRPFWCEGITQLVAHNPFEASFPSGHAAVMAALAMSMWYINRRLGVIFALAALVSGIARIVVGVHYPLDIIVGLACGIVAAVLARKMYCIVTDKPAKKTKK